MIKKITEKKSSIKEKKTITKPIIKKKTIKVIKPVTKKNTKVINEVTKPIIKKDNKVTNNKTKQEKDKPTKIVTNKTSTKTKNTADKKKDNLTKELKSIKVNKEKPKNIISPLKDTSTVLNKNKTSSKKKEIDKGTKPIITKDNNIKPDRDDSISYASFLRDAIIILDEKYLYTWPADIIKDIVRYRNYLLEKFKTIENINDNLFYKFLNIHEIDDYNEFNNYIKIISDLGSINLLNEKELFNYLDHPNQHNIQDTLIGDALYKLVKALPTKKAPKAKLIIKPNDILISSKEGEDNDDPFINKK